jgi:hypothetical protein
MLLGRVFVESVHRFGTIRWIGFLEGLDSERAGIELDSPPANSPGHSGEYKGQKIFPCAPGCGVFIKTSKLNFGDTVREAIEKKYIMSNESDSSTCSTDACNIPSPIFVGEEKANEFFSTNIFDLEEISMDNRHVRFDSDTDSEFLQSFTRLRRLSLCGNLFTNLAAIGQICHTIPTLEFADFSGNRCLISANSLPPVSPNLSELVLDDCHLVLDDSFIAWLNTCCPNLKRISFRNNKIGGKIFVSKFPKSLTFISLSRSNVFYWNIFELVSLITNNGIESLDIEGVPILPEHVQQFLPNLSHLHVSPPPENGWGLIKALSLFAPNLCSLSISPTSNSFYDSSMKTRAIIIVCFPNLNLLNNSIVRPSQRIEAAKYCASLLAKQDTVAVDIIPPNIAHQLVHNYKRDMEETIPGHTRLVSKSYWSLVIMAETQVPVRVPISSTLLELTSIVARRIAWPLKLSQLQLSVRSPNGDDGDIIVLNETSNLSCIDDYWYVFTSVCDK